MDIITGSCYPRNESPEFKGLGSCDYSRPVRIPQSLRRGFGRESDYGLLCLSCFTPSPVESLPGAVQNAVYCRLVADRQPRLDNRFSACEPILNLFVVAQASNPHYSPGPSKRDRQSGGCDRAQPGCDRESARHSKRKSPRQIFLLTTSTSAIESLARMKLPCTLGLDKYLPNQCRC